MTPYRVKFIISGEIEVSARSSDDAYKQVHEMSPTTLCDLGDPWVELDQPLSVTMSRVHELAYELEKACGNIRAYFSAAMKTDDGHE